VKYIVKTMREPLRGESGSLVVYYVYCTESKRPVTGTTYFKDDAQRLADGWNSKGKDDSKFLFEE